MLLAWMKPKFSELLAPSSKLLASLVFAGSVLFSAAASGQQAILDKTTLGSSQNDYRDFQNSLIVPKRNNLGKEKKEEVDLKTLQTKSSKDTTFQGNLMDLDLDWGGGKLGKPASSGDKDAKGPKTAEAGGEKDAKVSKQADTSGTTAQRSDVRKENAQRQTPNAQRPIQNDEKTVEAAVPAAKSTSNPTAADEKASEKEKASPSKPDGDH
jgi:hypothetical protein